MGKTTSDMPQTRKEHALARLVGQSPLFLKVLRDIREVSAIDATVLIEGETGTGKELVGRAIHYLSARDSLPFVPVNCGALPDTLVEAELFGHERGAFTDARQERSGLIRAAEGGTLCLDEIESLSSRAQVALLRVLQDGTFRALGSTREQQANVRFVAMSNTPLATLVRNGTFRADLYYRLSVFSLYLPPLRQRREDILPLAFHFLQKHARADRAVTDISAAARSLLETYSWPGNVRELENAIHRSAQLARATCLQPEDISWAGMRTPQAASTDSEEPADFTAMKRRAIELFERSYLTALMERCSGNVTRAARVAGKDRRDLGRLLKKHKITPKANAG